MKNLLYLLFLILVLPLTGLAQNDSLALAKEQPTTDGYRYNNQMDFDVESIAISLGYKFRISKNWLIGPGFGLGPVLSLGYIDNNSQGSSNGLFFTELMHIGIVIKKSKFNKTNKWSFEAQPRLGFIGRDEGQVFYTFNFGGSIYYGGKVQIGVRTTIGKVYNINNRIFLSSNLILRIPFKTN